MKFEDIVTVRIGRNLSRGNERSNLTLVAYSFENLTNDLDGSSLDSQANSYSGNSKHKYSYLSGARNAIFSFVSSKAGMVSELNKEKIINQNFTKLIIEHNYTHSSYLCYILNEL
ncbi:Type I restriction-modification system specificity subunit [Bacillus toyonensis BCT-7112]|nr:Type I restriction-modification system specificity subunit [Bacillus toyonensis BCT-7112]